MSDVFAGLRLPTDPIVACAVVSSALLAAAAWVRAAGYVTRDWNEI